jgi:hypothetical protein
VAEDGDTDNPLWETTELQNIQSLTQFQEVDQVLDSDVCLLERVSEDPFEILGS